MHIKLQLPIAPPRPINAVTKVYLSVAKLYMTKASGGLEKGPYFGRTLRSILAHWHFLVRCYPKSDVFAEASPLQLRHYLPNLAHIAC